VVVKEVKSGGEKKKRKRMREKRRRKRGSEFEVRSVEVRG
jgi:hypothetical protein